MDLLKQMLVYDHHKRITPKDAMNHQYFEPIKRSGILEKYDATAFQKDQGKINMKDLQEK